MAKASHKIVFDYLRDIIEEYLDDQLDIKLIKEHEDYQIAHSDAKPTPLQKRKKYGAWTKCTQSGCQSKR
jgi:hypothetical protein